MNNLNTPSTKELTDFSNRRTQGPSKKQLQLTWVTLASVIAIVWGLQLTGKIDLWSIHPEEILWSIAESAVSSTELHENNIDFKNKSI